MQEALLEHIIAHWMYKNRIVSNWPAED